MTYESTGEVRCPLAGEYALIPITTHFGFGQRPAWKVVYIQFPNAHGFAYPIMRPIGQLDLPTT